ncbi:MAG: hypothetical protein IPN13_22995 [Bacteroidetes bacterium]|nr:hypothetical protein [Bacteroidota bacterium]
MGLLDSKKSIILALSNGKKPLVAEIMTTFNHYSKLLMVDIYWVAILNLIFQAIKRKIVMELLITGL